MKLKNNTLDKELTKVYQEMVKDSLEIGTVAHIGSCPKFISDYFSNKFKSNIIHLPSINRKKHNKKIANLLNTVYSYLPTALVKIIANQY